MYDKKIKNEKTTITNANYLLTGSELYKDTRDGRTALSKDDARGGAE